MSSTIPSVWSYQHLFSYCLSPLPMWLHIKMIPNILGFSSVVTSSVSTIASAARSIKKISFPLLLIFVQPTPWFYLNLHWRKLTFHCYHHHFKFIFNFLLKKVFFLSLFFIVTVEISNYILIIIKIIIFRNHFWYLPHLTLHN